MTETLAKLPTEKKEWNTQIDFQPLIVETCCDTTMSSLESNRIIQMCFILNHGGPIVQSNCST